MKDNVACAGGRIRTCANFATTGLGVVLRCLGPTEAWHHGASVYQGIALLAHCYGQGNDGVGQPSPLGPQGGGGEVLPYSARTDCASMILPVPNPLRTR